MKLELKDLEKAVDKARKDGAVFVNIDHFGRTDRIMLKYDLEVGDTVMITLPEYNSGLWNEISVSKRF